MRINIACWNEDYQELSTYEGSGDTIEDCMDEIKKQDEKEQESNAN